MMRLSRKTSSSQCPSPTPAPFNEVAWDFQAHNIQVSLVTALVPSVLYGVLTILCIASIHVLTQRTGKIPITSLVLSLTLLVLFISTTIFVVFTMLVTQSTVLNASLYSAIAVWSLPLNGALELPPAGLINYYSLPQQCSGTAALTINILLGDAIVWWRATVIWRKNRFYGLIKGICVAFLLTTFGLGVVDTLYTCDPSLKWDPDHHVLGTGSMYGGFSYGVAASALSFSTNFCATALVGYKAWEARKRLRLYIVAGPVAAQVEKVFSLLVESGAVYCALWAVVVVWQSGMYQASIETHAGTGTFWDVFGVIINGALVPLIAIYPTIIIVLVALNRSHVENGLVSTSQTSSGGASIRLTTVRVDTMVTSHYDRPPQGRSDVLIIGEQDFGRGFRDGIEGSSTHTGDERKPDGII